MIILDLLAIVAPVFACAALGWIWAKLDRPFDSETITGLVVTIGTPCLVFDTLTRLQLSLAVFGQIALATVLAVTGFGALALLWLWLARMGRATFLPALMFPNSGNMGLPIALFAFGDIGLALGVAYFGIMVMLQFTVGVAIAAGSASPRMLLTSPIVYAVAAAVLVIGLGIPIPPVVGKTVNLLAGFTIPVMLIALGVSLAKLKVSSLWDSLAIAVARLLLGFGVGTAVAWALALPPVPAGVVIIQSSMPVAVFSYLFGLRYGRSPEALAGAVVLSTLLAFAFLPLVLWLVLPE